MKLPDGITTLGDNSFRNCSSLTSIVIPASLTSIGNHAFEASGLTSAIFVSQTLDNAKFNQEKTKKANNLKSSLAKSLALMAILILVGVVLEFILTLITTNKYNFTNIIETLMYASFVYCIILQIDITGCFVNIMKLKQDKEKE